MAQIRRGKNIEEEEEERQKPQDKNIMAPITHGGHIYLGFFVSKAGLSNNFLIPG